MACRLLKGDIMKNAKSMLDMGFLPLTQFELTKNIVTNLKHFELTPSAKLVLILLTTHYNPANGSVVFPSMPFISKTLGLGLTAVKQAINDLIKSGLIIKAKRDKISGNHNKYLLTLKVRNTTVKQSENELLKQSENDRFNITNKETKKEQTEKVIKPVINVDDFEKLKDYAVKKGVKYPAAYARKIIEAGNADKVLSEINAAQIAKENAKKRAAETSALLSTFRDYRAEAAPPPAEVIRKFELLKEKIYSKRCSK